MASKVFGLKMGSMFAASLMFVSGAGQAQVSEETPASPTLTAEGARTFLRVQLLNEVVQARLTTSAGLIPTRTVTWSGYSTQGYAAWPIRSAIFDGCKLTIEYVDFGDRAFQNGIEGSREIYSPAPITEVDFALVTDVTTDTVSDLNWINGEWITLRGTPLSLQVNSPNLAPRMTFALDFLRQACDPVANTGF